MKKQWKVFVIFSNGHERARSIMRRNDAREQYPGTSLNTERKKKLEVWELSTFSWRQNWSRRVRALQFQWLTLLNAVVVSIVDSQHFY